MPELALWAAKRIDEECHEAHALYEANLTGHYIRYFAMHPQLRSSSHLFSARDLAAALPPGWARLRTLLPPAKRHRHHLSAKSSQTLALALLGVAMRREPSLEWLPRAIPPLAGRSGRGAGLTCEHRLAPAVLGERPHQTSLDVLIEGDDFIVAAEAKWREAGIGACACEDSGGDPLTGRCSHALLERRAYWDAAEQAFGLEPRGDGFRCPISAAYQAIRNVAAIRALRSDRLGVFALFYDERNPYFRPTGAWPGWPAILADALTGSDVAFSAVSWQGLVQVLPLDEATREWARAKHGLV